MPRATRRRLVLIAAGLGLVALVIARAMWSPEVVVPVGTPIRFDDFTFAVEGSEERELGEGSSQARYLVVRLRVHNEARRVTYTFRPAIAVMVADDGRESGVSPAGQRALALLRSGPDPLAAPLAPGTEGTTELAFDLPDPARNPRLKISHGGPALDVVDDLIGGRKRLALKR